MIERQNLYIPSIDAKDLYLSNNLLDEKLRGYSTKKKDGTENYNKYVNSFDYSLDLIELREVANKIYGRKDKLSFKEKGKEYSSKIINVTFKYSAKQFNKTSKDIYVRDGYSSYNFDSEEDKISFNSKLDKDGYVIGKNENDENVLIAIKLNTGFYNLIKHIELLPSYFSYTYDNSTMKYTYHLNGNIPTVKSSKDLRTWLYENGFICNGIHYTRFKRSSGSARVGKCLFIDNRLYDTIHESEKCGLDIQKGMDLDIAAFEAYIALTTSSIIDTIKIKPENILVIDDAESNFKEVAICTGERDGELYTEEKEMNICNSIWDGQSLIDVSLMGNYSDKGMLLLRNKFFKSCCFNTNIQKFFEDNGITDISQLNGITIATDIKDVKLITTPSSIKYFKFGGDNRKVAFQNWLDNIYDVFGVVKYDKNTHFFDGRMVQAHYQLINSLELSKDDISNIVQDGLDYLSLINTNVDVMRYHLKFKVDNDLEVTNVMKNKNEIVYNMLNYDCGFENTKIYYKFKKELCSSYIKNMKKGHILIDGTYATLFGNPYEMLLQSIGKYDEAQSTLKPGEVHNIRYAYGEELLGSRSPHCTIGNILVTKNVACKIIDKYFNLTNNIICINSINENTLERLSGADFDSDSMIITNNKIMINAAKKNYKIFKVPTRDVQSEKSKRKYTKRDLAELDYKTSSNKIGEIVNLSQELNSLLWDMVKRSGNTIEEQYHYINEIYYDACQLDVMSNIEIDKCKKEFSINNTRELKKIREKYSDFLNTFDDRKSMPDFMGYIAETKGYRNDVKKSYKKYKTSMDYLHECIDGFRSKKGKGKDFKNISDIFKPDDFDDNYVNKKQVVKILEMVQNANNHIKILYDNKNISLDERKYKINKIKNDLLYDLNKIKLNQYTLYRLLWNIDNNKNISIKNLLFYILFDHKNNNMIKLINKYDKVISYLESDENGCIVIYNKKYMKKYKK